jgi:hypothetical protein
VAVTDSDVAVTEIGIADLGPVDYLVVEFPLDKADFSGEAMQELKSLVDRGLIRVLDLIFIHKLPDGSIEAFEAHEYDQAGVLAELDMLALELLAEEDVDALAAVVEPDTVAAILVWENTWAGPFGAAVRRAGGQLVANGRIPVQGILAAVEADLDEMEGA